MASKVTICNLALSIIGSPASIESADPFDASEEGEKCSEFYPIARDQVLESHTWAFATMRRALTAVDLPSYIYTWQYAYGGIPTLMLRPVAVLAPGNVSTSNALLEVWAPSGAVTDDNSYFSTNNDPKPEDFIIETDDLTGEPILYTNVQGAILKYIWLNDDPTRYTPAVTRVIARLLASYLAGTLQKDEDKAEKQLKIYETLELPRAQGFDMSMQRNNGYRAGFKSSIVKARA